MDFPPLWGWPGTPRMEVDHLLLESDVPSPDPPAMAADFMEISHDDGGMGDYFLHLLAIISMS